MARFLHTLTVRRSPGLVPHMGLIGLDGESLPCILGRSGITTAKFEGDGATPSGNFRVLYGYYRADRIQIPATSLSMIPSRPDMGWCDDVASANYNRPVKLPFCGRHEELQRGDRLYDVCIVLDYNISERTRNRGSAIFFHLTHPGHAATQGCIAIEPDLMMKILPRLTNRTIMKIFP